MAWLLFIKLSSKSLTSSYLNAIKARFNARIQQVKAERVIEMAQEHNAMALKRTDLASTLAQAMAAREESNQKLVALQKRQAELQTASLVNWSKKLAMFKKGSADLKEIEQNLPPRQIVEIPVSEDSAAVRAVSNLEF